MALSTVPIISEVGPRDGIQNEKIVLSITERIELINRLSACGVDRIEIGSFVNPRAVPPMAETDRVLAGIVRRAGVEYAALALNLRGGLQALEAGVDRINFSFAASETFNQRNQGATVEQSLGAFAQVVEAATARSVPVTIILATAFGCPFEGDVPLARICDIIQSLRVRGASEIVLADTIGVGVPMQVERIFAAVRDATDGALPIGAHFHDTRGTGLANADMAIRCGTKVLDASVGGFGGCPFAPAATGNIATEDLGYLLRQSGVPMRLNLPELIAVGRFLGERLGHLGTGTIQRAGLYPENVALPVKAS